MKHNDGQKGYRFVPGLKKTMVTSLLTGALMSGYVLTGCSSAQVEDAGEFVADAPVDQQDESASTQNDQTYDSFEQVAAAFDAQALDLDYSKRDTDSSYDDAISTHIALAGSSATIEGEGAQADANTITISAEGTYVVSGELSNGQLLVEAPEDAKVQIVLDGATLHNDSGPALYVKQADKCFITLADGSVNELSDGTEYVLEEDSDEPSAALFARADLTLNGSGTLTVDGTYDNGIYTKDDLVITSGTYRVEAVGDALRGRDCVKISDGTFDLVAGGDGIKSNKDTKPTQGFVSIDGGELTIEAEDDGIQGKTYVRIAGGSVDIISADDAIHSDLEGVITGGELSIDAGDDAFHAETKLVIDEGNVEIISCVEGYEAQEVIVNGGMSNITASDDALNAAVADLSDDEGTDEAAGAQDPGAAAASEGAPEPPSGNVPAGAEGAPEPPSGEMPNGAEGAPEPPSGDMPNGAPDAAAESGEFAGRGGMRGDMGGNMGGNMGGGPGGMSEVSEACLLQINGGTLIINAGGDGVDSNGGLEINGGIVLVNGPDSGADSALDYELSAMVSGGSVLMLGSAGMAETFTGGEQPFATVMASGQAGQNVAVVDEQGNVLVSLNAEKAFDQVIASSPQMSEGGTYSVVIGGTPQSADVYGFAESGSISGGNATEVTASTTPTQVGGMGGMRGGGPGGFERGAGPGGMQA